jgi:hypothetical protein
VILQHAQVSPEHRQFRPCSRAQATALLVAGVGMAHHAGGGVVPEHALDALRRRVGAVADDDHAGVLRVAHADAAAVVQADPGGAAGGVEQRVEQRPVGDGVAAVLHAFGLAVGLATEPASRWSRPMTIGAFSSPT